MSKVEEDFEEVIHNSEIFDVLDNTHIVEEKISDNAISVDWQKYHPTTQEELEESYVRLNAALDYSAEPENYKQE